MPTDPQHVVLYRRSMLDDGELQAIQSNFFSTQQRVLVPQLGLKHDDLVVIGRMSVLPHYTELERDLQHLSCRLINSAHEHAYVADLGSYVDSLGELTFPTWSSLAEAPRSRAPFVLKGATNSKKWQWKTHMFAETWSDAVHVQSRLLEDGFIGDQRIYVREYHPLKRLYTTLSGVPISKEFRFFVLHDRIVGSSFYWDAFREDIVESGAEVPSPDEVPQLFLDEAIWRLKGKCPFYVMDIAQGKDDRWWIVELNDGQMSGLSGIDPAMLYARMRDVLSLRSSERTRNLTRASGS